MRAPTTLRAGDIRRPARRRLVQRVVSSACASLVAVGLLAGQAVAQQPSVSPPPLPPSIQPGTPQPPAPPALPAPKGKGKAKAKAKGTKGKDKSLPNRDRGKKHASVQQLQASCSPFDHTQSYPTWGPALAYGGPVTVSYAAERCSTPNGSALDLNVQGTATVTDAAGTVIDTKPFSVTGTWNQPGNAVGWPPAWWACEVSHADYTWQIQDVYTFHVAATNGLWNLDVSNTGQSAHSVHWTHDGCA